MFNSNDNANLYVVQCTKDNIDDVHCMLQMSANILDIDFQNHSIKTASLDGLMKRRLTDAGASFWQEAAKPVVVKKRLFARKF